MRSTSSSEVADTIDYYFLYGPEFDKVVAGYRELTGAAPMFGKWAYGFWQCKNRYKSQAELLGVAQKYRELKIPIDNIVQDWFWWNRKGEHVFNQNYPDPKGMIDQLHRGELSPDDLGVAVLRAGLDRLRNDGQERLVHRQNRGREASRITRRKWRCMTRAIRKRASITGSSWTTRCSRSASTPGGSTLPSLKPKDARRTSNSITSSPSAAAIGTSTSFPLMTTTAVYEGQRAASDQKRVFILSRSAFAGSQRNAVTAWSGDINSDWITFRRQIPAGLNFELSGLPYWTTDIGGFVSGNPDDPAYRELFHSLVRVRHIQSDLSRAWHAQQ